MAAKAFEPLTGARLMLAAVGLALANFIVILDTTITNVSVPHIAGGLAISPSQGTWTITSYAVADAIAVPLTGWLVGRFGAYRMLVSCLCGFALFSMLCGLARSIELLVLFRILQGLSGGPLMPLTQTLLMRIFPPEKMGAAMALWGMTTISAPIFGPLIGGYISDEWSWPWIFYINIPAIAGALLIVTQLVKRYETPTRKERIDSIGLVLLVLFVGSFQIMLDLGHDYDWFSSRFIVALAVIAAISFGAFLIWELTEAHPMVDLRVLRHRTMMFGAPAMALGYGAFFSTIVLIPLWLQSVVGYTAGESGHVMALMGVFAVMMAPVAGKVIEKADVRIFITAGMLWMAAMLALRMDWTVGADWWTLALPQLLQGAGMTFFFIGLNTYSMSAVPAGEVASAAGVLAFMRTATGAIGTALATSTWDANTRASRDAMVGTLNDASGAITRMEASGMSMVQARSSLERLVDGQAATTALITMFGIAAVVMVSASGLVWFGPKPRLGAKAPVSGH